MLDFDSSALLMNASASSKVSAQLRCDDVITERLLGVLDALREPQDEIARVNPLGNVDEILE